MPQRKQAIPIISTKLNRPPVPADMVPREALYSRLEEGRQLPLSLITAPAGYGKTTLISHWLQTREQPSAWLSLDKEDSDLRVFLSYLVAAARTVVPACCGNMLAKLQADEPLVPRELALALCNDLNGIEAPLILALDDYHCLHNTAIHEFVDRVLEHPPRNLHLAIMSRWDPPLSLATMRGRHLMTEVRLQDLQFNEAETAVFVERALDRAIAAPILERLQDKTEGWPVALRLVSLALRNRTDLGEFIGSFGSRSRPLEEYLVAEILSQQSAEIRDCLCRTSILDRFSAPLGQALCGMNCGEGNCIFRSHDSDRPFPTVGLLCIPLDDRQEWYRFHHLFQELLQQFLKKSLDPGGIAGLHSRAAAWFEKHGLLEEAIRHALKGGDPSGAGRMIARHGIDLLNEEQWHRLDQWLGWLPPGTAENDPELLMLKAWLMQNRGRYGEAIRLIDSVEELTATRSSDPATTQRLRGEVNALRSYQKYAECKAELAIECAEQALLSLPPECHSQRGYATIVLAAGLQMRGDLGRAREIAYGALARESMPGNPSLEGRLLSSLCFVDWMAADLPALKRTASQLIELSNEHRLSESGAMGGYFAGIAAYERNELSAAEKSLLPVVSHSSSPNMEFFAQSAFALACVCQARGQADKARELVDSVCEHMLRIRNTAVLQMAQAFQADLALRQGRISESLAWAQGFDPEPFQPMYRFHSPQITLAKALSLQGNTESRERAGHLLDRLEHFLSEIHNRRFLIEVLALQALLHQDRRDESKARAALSKALSLAQPGGFVRPFVDLGPDLARLLIRLGADAATRPYIDRILNAFSGSQEAESDQSPQNRAQAKAAEDFQPLLALLTNRELEILGMLAKRFSNKEIGDQLHIAAATVKRHAENIYSKLGVSGRQGAVVKAKSLGILEIDQ